MLRAGHREVTGPFPSSFVGLYVVDRTGGYFVFLKLR